MQYPIVSLCGNGEVPEIWGYTCPTCILLGSINTLLWFRWIISQLLIYVFEDKFILFILKSSVGCFWLLSASWSYLFTPELLQEKKSRQVMHLLYTSRPILLGAGSSDCKESSPAYKRPGFHPWSGQRNLAGCSPRGLQSRGVAKCLSNFAQQTSYSDILTFRNSFSH